MTAMIQNESGEWEDRTIETLTAAVIRCCGPSGWDLYSQSDAISQQLKALSECGEACDSVNKGDYEQLKDDVGGFGRKQSIAIFGKPGEDKFEFVLISRHMTLRCDGNSSEHVAFGGPILYAHEGERTYEKAHHPNNVFWHQAVAANQLYNMFDGKQRHQALVRRGMPSEEEVQFRGAKGPFFGIPVTTFSADQKDHLQGVVKRLLDPFRQSDQDEVVRCLKVQGGLDNCHLAFFEEGDLGRDKVYDNWRLEGPSFVWYFRGKPHVHVWVNVADTHKVKLNSYQNSIGV